MVSRFLGPARYVHLLEYSVRRQRKGMPLVEDHQLAKEWAAIAAATPAPKTALSGVL